MTYHVSSVCHSNKRLVCYALILLIVILVCNEESLKVSNATPSSSTPFPLQGIYDETNDWVLLAIDIMGFERAKSLSDCIVEGNLRYPAADIAAAGYTSDGELLNSRLWLSSPFGEPDISSSAKITPVHRSYTLLVDVDSAYDIGQTYQLVIEWDPVTHLWKKIIKEGAPPGLPAEHKNIISEYNYTGFFERGQSYVDLSFNLSAISFPDRYSLVAYVSDTYRTDNEKLCHLIDITDAVHVPPPEFALTASPSTVVLRPGEERILELKITNTNAKLNSHMLLSSEEISDFNVTFTPAEISIPPEGISTSAMSIRVGESSSPRTFTIPINAEVSFPTTFANNLIDQSLNNTPSARISKSYDVAVTVLEPITLQEKIITVMNDADEPIYYITGAFATIITIVTGILGWKVWNRSKRNKN